jgi:hypothetical protein
MGIVHDELERIRNETAVSYSFWCYASTFLEESREKWQPDEQSPAQIRTSNFTNTKYKFD